LVITQNPLYKIHWSNELRGVFSSDGRNPRKSEEKYFRKQKIVRDTILDI
jgi:hypothetical protein